MKGGRAKIRPDLRLVQHNQGALPKHEKDWSLLMARAQLGDGQAYMQLLTDITPYVRSLALRRLRSPHDAEDGVQDVLLTLHSIRHTYDPDRPFGPWLTTIAERRLIDHLRRVMRRARREAPLNEDFDLANPSGENADRLDHPALLRAVEALPARQKEAIKLLKLREMSLDEASRLSGQSIGALKVATHRALATLRHWLHVDIKP